MNSANRVPKFPNYLKVILILSLASSSFLQYYPEPLNQIANAQNPLEASGVTFNNKTGFRIYLQLNGPQVSGLWLEPGKTNTDLEPGTYSFSYWADGGYEKGSFKVSKGSTQVTLALLRNRLSIKDQIHQTIFIYFKGPRNYYFQLVQGNYNLDLVPGNYSYSFYADGENVTGLVNLRSSKSIVLKLVRTNLKVVNNTGSPIYVSITGPNNYSRSFYYVPTTVPVIPGTYTFSYYLDGSYVSETAKITGSSETFQIGIPPTRNARTESSNSGSGEDNSGSGNCNSSYPTVCIPSPPPDLDCNQVPYDNFQVIGSDPHGFDGDNDGIGCES